VETRTPRGRGPQTDAEWAIVERLIPPTKSSERRRSVNVREVLEALPKDLPPKSTVRDYLELWNWDGTLERIHCPSSEFLRQPAV
jgi:transposase